MMHTISLKKELSFLAVLLLCACPLLFGVSTAQAEPTAADAVIAPDIHTQPEYFYYQQLNETGRVFYEALEYLTAQNDWLDGTISSIQLTANSEYGTTPLKNSVNPKILAEYIQGQSSTLMNAFTEAVNAFFLEYPELFYIDFSKLCCRVGYRAKSNSYIAFLELSKDAANCYRFAAISSPESIQQASAALQTRIREIVSTIPADAAPAEKIKAAHDALIASAAYQEEMTAYAESRPYLHTAYGALVMRETVCDGFAYAFQLLMKQLGIPCISICGLAGTEGPSPLDNTAVAAASSWESHRWNAVALPVHDQLVWFAVDCTWDKSRIYTYLHNPKTPDHPTLLYVNESVSDTYLLQGSAFMDKTHVLCHPVTREILPTPPLSPVSYAEAVK